MNGFSVILRNFVGVIWFSIDNRSPKRRRRLPPPGGCLKPFDCHSWLLLASWVSNPNSWGANLRAAALTPTQPSPWRSAPQETRIISVPPPFILHRSSFSGSRPALDLILDFQCSLTSPTQPLVARRSSRLMTTRNCTVYHVLNSLLLFSYLMSCGAFLFVISFIIVYTILFHDFSEQMYAGEPLNINRNGSCRLVCAPIIA